MNGDQEAAVLRLAETVQRLRAQQDELKKKLQFLRHEKVYLKVVRSGYSGGEPELSGDLGDRLVSAAKDAVVEAIEGIEKEIESLCLPG
jgi:hypothetical protein